MKNNRQIYSINQLEDLEEINPEETIEYPGFYYFPDDKRLCVSKNGTVLNFKTGKILKCCIHKKSRSLHIHVTSTSSNRSVYKLHRIIARTFVGRPKRHIDKSFSELEVNHIDGNRNNNSVNNLEWVTRKENSLHAHRTGLHSKDLEVLAKNINTGEIIRFHTIKHCASVFNIHRGTLWKHLTKGNVGKYQKNNYVFKLNDEHSWPEYPVNQIRELGSGNERTAVMVHCFKSNKIIVFETVKQASEYTKYPYISLYRHLVKNKKIKTSDFEYTKLYDIKDF